MDRPNWLTFPNQGPPEVRIFAFGCLLGSLVQSLQLAAQSLPSHSRTELLLHADLLLRYWANLQEVMLDGNASYSEALIHPIVERFQESLEDAGQLSPEPTWIYQELRRGLEVFSSPKFLVES